MLLVQSIVVKNQNNIPKMFDVEQAKNSRNLGEMPILLRRQYRWASRKVLRRRKTKKMQNMQNLIHTFDQKIQTYQFTL